LTFAAGMDAGKKPDNGIARVCGWKSMPATGKRTHVSWTARRQWSWRSLDVRPLAKMPKGGCGVKDQVS